MVKGVSRRVVVVRPDECGLFEQAIFLVRDYSAPRSDVVRAAAANRQRGSWGWLLPPGCWFRAQHGQWSAWFCENAEHRRKGRMIIVHFSYGLYMIFNLY